MKLHEIKHERWLAWHPVDVVVCDTRPFLLPVIPVLWSFTSWPRIHVRLHTESPVDVGQPVNKVPFTLLFSFFLTEALWEEHFSPFIAGELRLQKVKQLSLELTNSLL